MTHRRTQSNGLAVLGAGTASPGFPPRRRADATPLPGGPSLQAAKSGAQAAGPRRPERFLGWSGPSPDSRGIARDQGYARLRFSEGPTRSAVLLSSPTPWERENNGDVHVQEKQDPDLRRGGLTPPLDSVAPPLAALADWRGAGGRSWFLRSARRRSSESLAGGEGGSL